MPIKPENRSRYPANWKSIRAAVLDRADHRCERCAAPNGEIIVRGQGDHTDTYMRCEGDVYDANTGDHLGMGRMDTYQTAGRGIVVVLTIAHLDHMPENCDGMEHGGPVLPVEESNLRAWCQRCHLNYDKHHHAHTAYATRKARALTNDLFSGATS